jgi:hypothetical protein
LTNGTLNVMNNEVLHCFLSICYKYPYEDVNHILQGKNPSTFKEISKLMTFISKFNNLDLKNLKLYFGSGIYKIYVIPALQFLLKTLNFQKKSKIYPQIQPTRTKHFPKKLLQRKVELNNDFVSFSFLSIFKKFANGSTINTSSILKSFEGISSSLEFNLLKHLISAFLNENDQFFVKHKKEVIIEDSKPPKKDETEQDSFWKIQRSMVVPHWARKKSIKKPKKKLDRTNISKIFLE